MKCRIVVKCIPLFLLLFLNVQPAYSDNRELRPDYLKSNSIEPALRNPRSVNANDSRAKGNPIKRLSTRNAGTKHLKRNSKIGNTKKRKWQKRLENLHNQNQGQNKSTTTASENKSNRRRLLKEELAKNINEQPTKITDIKCLPEHIRAQLIIRNPSYVNRKRACIETN